MAHLMQPQTFTRTSVLTRRAHRSLSSAVLHHFSSHCVAVAIETLSRNRNGKDQGTVVMALASFPGSSAPERDIEVVHACLFRVPESLGTRLC